MSTARKILVVDEDPATSQTFAQVLTGKGYVVETAASGEDALWVLADGGYDLVFTELAMRGMSGLDVAEELHASQPRLPVVIVTASGAEAVQKRAMAAGVTEFLHKPVAPEQLAEVAGRVLQGVEPAATSQSQAVAGAASAQAAAKPVLLLKNVVLFLMAPFVGLFYILIFPVVGLGMLASLLFGAQKQEPEGETESLQPAEPSGLKVPKTIVMMFVATAIGIAFAVVAPLLGIGVVLWLCFQAWGKLGAKVIKT